MTPLLLTFALVAPSQVVLPVAPPSAVAQPHPFQRLPRICNLTPAQCSDGLTEAKPAWVQEFHQTAHFPLPRFNGEGKPIEGDGLLIYEGMQLSVYADGSYKLTFTATVPDMPVTIRLQLGFAEKRDSPPKYFITLPPIRLEPTSATQNGDTSGNTFAIEHKGYSSLLSTSPTDACNTPKAGINCSWVLTRSGTARFGSSIAIEQTNP